MRVNDLIAFEEDIAACFRRGEIRAPIHLGGGNERQLIDIFANIQPYDWVLAGWRSHFHCLLKGVPPAKLKAAILAGHSISLCFPEYNILCSGIVGGIGPIAVGIAAGLKRKHDLDPSGNSLPRVHVFIGDMTARSGIIHESMAYAKGHRLPVHWIVEDNGRSICTDTAESWGYGFGVGTTPVLSSYKYKLNKPHSGIGEWVNLK